MTGEELYARWCEAIASDYSRLQEGDPLPAWPFLERSLQSAWEKVAKGLPTVPPELTLIDTKLPKLPEHHSVYRCLSEGGGLLYVGASSNPSSRIYAHSREAAWWPEVRHIRVEQHPTREEMLAAERAAILKEQPVHNKNGKVGRIA